MGTTIRRQPLSFPIPASPDYRFLNITDFGGLNVSSNPFVVSSNTASDCLNVYVDEDNALSTRPRLQAKYDLMCLAGLDDEYELIDVYALHNGYLLHVKKNGYGYMYKFVEENGVLQNPTPISGTTPTEKCKIFEQKGNIYLLTGSGYKNIIKNKISDVEGYIPTTTIGKYSKKSVKNSDGSTSTEINPAGESYESLNLLSDNYKETYFWDGTTSIDSWRQSKDDVVINDYVSADDVYVYDENDNVFDGLVLLQPIKGLFDEEAGKTCFLCWTSDERQVNRFGSSFVLMVFDKHNNLIVDESYGVPFKKVAADINGSFDYNLDYRLFSCSDNGLSVVCVSWNTVWNKPNYLYVCTRRTTTEPFKQTFSTGPELYNDEQQVGFYQNPITEKYVLISSDGRVISYRSDENTVSLYYYNDLNSTQPSGVTINDCVDYDITIYDESNYLFVGARQSLLDKKDTTGVVFYLYKKSDTSIVLSSATDLITPWNREELARDVFIKAVPNQKTCYVSAKILLNGTFTRSALFKVDFEANVKIIKQSVEYEYYSGLNLKLDNDKEYMYFKKPNSNIDGRFSVISDDGFTSSLGLDFDITDAVIKQNEAFGLKLHTHSTVDFYTRTKFLFESTEPLLTIIRHVRNLDAELFDSYYKRMLLFKSSKIHTRFDNNSWFASKNYTFHTEYNDPTYIPLSSYNDLGEDFEEITGLSIVNDNVLAAYKRNRIYIITPVTVGNQETYSYTETKNVIGNDVPDAPILTILTEMPTIVSYDGIFALNQLENVQSSDRITTLISENINPRWLKESKQDIDDCKTLNRLYWTYYILPHRQVGAETADYTKIYLLDNRTQQWYYWELPIYVMNAMIKDNKTHFIHEDGTVYTLETTDLLHEFNPDVTEYYDGVGGEKLIIPWNWTSQILSLNTINYSKKLVDTTFVLTDTDTQDEYGLDYSFKAWRKSVSETNATTISNNIHYVQSTTKRTMIPRFNFIQIKLSNTAEDLDNNKLRLVGLGLKYVLLEGLY